jgi:carboxyl-terminal processing protease
MRRSSFWIAVGLVAILLLGTSSRRFRSAGSESELPPEFERALASLMENIDRWYVQEVDYQKLAVGAVQGVLSKLDEYSVYMPGRILDEFETGTRGEFGGLGIEIRFDPLAKVVVVEQPIPGTPAFEKGLLGGDLIVEVSEPGMDEPIKTADFEDVYDAVRVLRGDPGTEVTVTVLRGDDREPMEFTLTRGVIHIPGVRAAELVDPGRPIGYVFIAYFHEKTIHDLVLALEDLHAQGAEGVVLDMRFNPGGLLESALDVANLFLDSRMIVRVEGRNRPARVYESQPGDAFPDLSLVVLVNRYSASAAEIVAAALGDNDRARLVGEPTHGKASVQQIFHLPAWPRRQDPFAGPATEPEDETPPDGYKMTIAHYYTPADQPIAEKGVTPDVEVLLDEEGQRALAQALQAKIDYPPHSPEEQREPEGEPSEIGNEPPGGDTEAEPHEQASPDQAEPAGDAAPDEPFRDTQLERAIEVLAEVIAEARAGRQPVAVGADAPEAGG